jgi:aspartyl/glutamyl-tRNA(Asn/Gln) amidotransferase C subunit
MSISLDEVRHVAKLARLQLDEAEILALQGELNVLLGHFVDIQSLELAALRRPPASVSLQIVWSEDLVAEPMAREDVLGNAPVSKAGLFVVPTIIED